MKIDAMTLGAIAFAGFAAYTALKPKTPAQQAKTAADIAFAQAKAQRVDVGGALWQNSIGWLNLTPSQMGDFAAHLDELRAQNIL